VAERLAVAEASTAADRRPLAVEFVIVSTRGDEQTGVPLHAIGGQGVFVNEVDDAVREGRADAAVHSAKDLPSGEPAGGDGPAPLPIVAVLERADPRDALVGCTLDELAPGALVATGSVRRRAQLAWLRPDLFFTDLRGNIATRLGRVPSGGAIVMAQAALDRLGKGDRSSQVLSVCEMLPQVGQGAVAVTCRADGGAGEGAGWPADLFAALDHPGTRSCVEAERAFLRAIGGGCDLPVGAHARQLADGTLQLDGLIAGLDGHRLVRSSISGTDPGSLGAELASRVLARGGAGLLDEESARR
jgi:hydroxymethylbilane synthase